MAEVFRTSRLLPALHGFSTRLGGVSEGPYRSLNVGFAVGDEPARVEENLERLAAAAGFPLAALRTVSQVHGDRVVEAPEELPAGEGSRPPCAEADALWTGRQGEVVGVRTADCVPILIAEPAGRRVAVVHSGWRGTELGVVARALEALVAGGASPERLVAAIGPSIQACCYAVSEDLALRFSRRFGPEIAVCRGGQWYLDLPGAVRGTLRRVGLRDDRIDLLPDCTSCDAERYFSHRRDKGVTGRHLSFVACGSF